MSLPQPLDPCGDPCAVSDMWGISLELAQRITRMSQERDLPFGLSIISGARSCEEQNDLIRSGATTLPCCSSGARPCSTHTSIPATGADLWPSVAVTNAVKAHFGRAAVFAGLRWGGGSPLDADGFPTDWNHVDLGAAM